MLREKRNIELWRMSKVLYQIWDWWRLQGNPARHNDAPKLRKKKNKTKQNKKKKKRTNLILLMSCRSRRCRLALFLVFWASGEFEVKIRLSYNSLDFKDFLFLFFFLLFFLLFMM